MALRPDSRLPVGVLLVLLSQLASQPAMSASPACDPFMATEAAPKIQEDMLKGLLEDTKAEECKFQLRELQSIQKTMEEYRKAGNTLTPAQRESQSTLIEGSLEATQQLFDRCRGEAKGGQIMQAGLDLTSIALFGVLQNNPGAWLVASGVDLIRRLGAVLQTLFTWDTPENRAKRDIDLQANAQADAARMQRKMCLYVNYLDAVAALEDSSRQDWRKKECGKVAGGSICEACAGFDRELKAVLAKLQAGTESRNCELIRWEVAGVAPAKTELEKIFPRSLTAGSKPRSLLAARVQQLLATIQKTAPDSSKDFRASWDSLQDLAASPTSTCQEVAAGWESFLKRFEPLFTAEEFQYYVGLKQAIDNFDARKNQDTEALSNSVSQLLVNVQFAGFAAGKSAALDSASETWNSQNDILDRVFKPGSKEKLNCPFLANTLRKARGAIKDIETPFNMCKVLKSRELSSRETPLFGDRVNPVRQSNAMWMETRDGTRLDETCTGVDQSLQRMVREYGRYEGYQKRIQDRCGDGYSIEWPNSLGNTSLSFRF